MKSLCWVGAILVVAATSVTATGEAVKPIAVNGDKSPDYGTFIDGNNLLMFISNTGSIAYDRTAYLGRYDGLYFPDTCRKTLMFAAGIWLSAMADAELCVAAAEYATDYAPGPMANGTYQPDDPRFRVYKIRTGDTRLSNPDYAEWPFDDGAPALKAADGQDSLDAQGDKIPLILGELALWTVFNHASEDAIDSDPSLYSVGLLHLEIQLYAYAYDTSDDLGRTIFLQYTLMNKGTDLLDEMHISLWADVDLGGASDDFVGCSPARSLGFAYNSNSYDQIYGENPPAVGFKILQGPVAADPTSSAWIPRRQVWEQGYRNLPMTAFNKYINGTDPNSAYEAYSYMRGLDRDGSVIVNPTTGQPTTFVMDGNPVTQTGWLDANSTDCRFMLSCGPFEMAPGDTQEVVAAVMVGASGDYTCVIPLFVDTVHAEHVAGSSDGRVYALILDPAATTGHDYHVGFEGEPGNFTWYLEDITVSNTLLTGQGNQSGNDDYPVVDGMMVKVVGGSAGVGDWDIPNGTLRFTWAGGADGLGFEGFNGAIGWGGPGDTRGFGSYAPVSPLLLPNVLIKLAPTDADGNFDSGHADVSYAYRYLRNADDPSARPEFAPYIVNPENGTYGFQDFTKSCPLSAWNIDTDPPTRLTIGFLENNVLGGLVDGRYWPPYFVDQDNTATDGPREWLWIYLDEYDETPNPDFMGNSIEDPMPIMYWLTVARRDLDPWLSGDEFLIIPAFNYNTGADLFALTAPPPLHPMSKSPANALASVADLFSVDSTATAFFQQNFGSECECTCHGDPYCDGVQSNVFDVVRIIDVTYRGLPADHEALCPRFLTDVNCDGAINLLDVTLCIDVSFRAGDPAGLYCQPCPLQIARQ